MSKKMKRVAFDLTPQVLCEDARARFKHEALLQDFLELQEETEASRKKLMALKQKQSILQAEVRFLRRRREFLLKNRSPAPQERVFAKPKPTRIRKSKKETASVEQEAAFCNSEKKRAFRAPVFDLNLESGLYGANERAVHRAIRGSSSNQRVRIRGPKAAPVFDLNEKDGTFRGQEPAGQTRVPVIDLNQVSKEEEELQDGFQPFDLRMEGSGSGSGSLGRPGKRKISWQDHVVLRV